MTAEYYKMKEEKAKQELQHLEEEMCKKARKPYVKQKELPPSKWQLFKREHWTLYGDYNEMRAAFEEQNQPEHQHQMRTDAP